MVFMIFFKWIAYGATAAVKYQPRCAPSILNLFIDMMLFQDPEKENTQKCELTVCEKDPCGKFMFGGQKELQFALITIAMICIPWMLLGNCQFLQNINKFFKKKPLKFQNAKCHVLMIKFFFSLRQTIVYYDETAKSPWGK